MKNNNTYIGILFVAVALLFGTNSLINLSIGSITSPGPGLFPLIASVALLVLGLFSIMNKNNSANNNTPGIKNLIIIILSIVGFGVVTKFSNLILGTATLVLLSLLAAPENYLKRAIILFVALLGTSLCFKYFLGVNLPLWKS